MSGEYIGESKKYLRDLINPRLPSLTAGQLSRSFSPEEIKANLADISQALAASPVDAQLAEIEKDEKRRLQVLETIRAMAHERMVALNRAYQEIRNLIGPKKATIIAGYDSRTVFNQKEQAYEQWIELEGHGEISIYDKPFEYSVAGPYLSFDWGPTIETHKTEDDFRLCIPLKLLFIHLEMERGEKPSAVLLQDFFDCFSLTEDQQKCFREILSHKTTPQIMQSLQIPALGNIDLKDRNTRLRSLHFERQTNQLKTLNLFDNGGWPEYGLSEYGFTAKVTKDNKLVLTGYKETVFSEADFILMQTLAYGPLLK